MEMLLILLVIIGVLGLQVYLSQMKNKWPGLVLPIIAFLVSLALPVNMAVRAGGVTADLFGQMVVIWLLVNIPTAIFGGMYWFNRRNLRRNGQPDKQKAQDMN